MNPKLYILSGKDLGSVFEIEDGALVGRAEDCAVSLTDSSISRQHARFEREGGHWHLIDLDSRNGLHQGEVRLERVVLVDLDEFFLGDVRLRFRFTGESKPSASAPKGKPAGAKAGRPRPDPAATGGLELEEEIDLEALSPKVSQPNAHRAPSKSAAAEEVPPGDAVQERRAQLLRNNSSRSNFLTDAIEDRPLWVSILIFLIVLALCGGLAFGVFRLVTGMRGA